ncbi:MAG TPA: SDR family oxidoreductase [Terriglobales bacterium]|nr:SDR family oxidoreductase [Terriglobales bacterium]
MKQLEGKTAIITGGGLGIGKGIARAFTDEGARIMIASRNEERLSKVEEELRSRGATVVSFPADVSREHDVLALFERTMKEFGRVDILVNCAGLIDQNPLEETSLERWRKVIDVNLTGPFLCTREAFKIMRRQGGGRIVNVGSISAQMPRPQFAAYSSSKMGLVALTTTTALEGRDCGIVASCIHPGNVKTAMNELTQDEPAMEIEDVVRAVMVMVTMPPSVNMLQTIILPVTQLYLGRG